jgi:hypothetical protein
MRLAISTVPGTFAICRLPADAAQPSWPRGRFVSITRTPDELSIVCEENAVPADIRADRGWCALRVEGPLPFEMTGVAAALVSPLADARISVFVIATFDTDYLLLKDEVYARGVEVLRAAGHDLS